ncbi:cupin domain-containing protein [Jannaschia sp. W003]|uniref:cupin domain-containing protein n=1 Tax=Jannaschia sp. W003 TaxID=2867012 RepID=UPI0021A3EDCD|nr:cupin domain-containing protein [Jannaschia sp. W003]UWQ20647.1 cupin domain-containing protein [Jannaschia sp. W003]
MKDTLAQGDAVEWLGVTYRTILDAADSGGAMSIVDSVSPPDSGPPRHVHEREDEAFVVLSGEIEWWMEGRRGNAGPGDTVFVPRGCEHTFRVVGDLPCRHLVILTPGGFDGFFREMAEGGYAIPEDMEAIEASATRHHLRFTGPPLAADGAEGDGA